MLNGAETWRLLYNIVIHCRQGIGRSSIVAAIILTRQGATVEEAFDRLAEARGRPVPDTPEQREWVANLVRNF